MKFGFVNSSRKLRRMRAWVGGSSQRRSTSVLAKKELGCKEKSFDGLMSSSEWINSGSVLKEQRIHSRIIIGLRVIRVELQKNHKEKKAFGGFIQDLRFNSDGLPVFLAQPRISVDSFLEISQDLWDLRKVVESIFSRAKVENLPEDELKLLVFKQFLDDVYWPRDNVKLVDNAYLIYTHPLFFDAMERYLFVHKVYQIRSLNVNGFHDLKETGIFGDWLETVKEVDTFKSTLQYRTDENELHVMYENEIGIALFLRNAIEHVPVDMELARMENNLYFRLPYAWSATHFVLSKSAVCGDFEHIFQRSLEQCFQDGSIAIPREEDPTFIIEYAG